MVGIFICIPCLGYFMPESYGTKLDNILASGCKIYVLGPKNPNLLNTTFEEVIENDGFKDKIVEIVLRENFSKIKVFPIDQSSFIESGTLDITGNWRNSEVIDPISHFNNLRRIRMSQQANRVHSPERRGLAARNKKSNYSTEDIKIFIDYCKLRTPKSKPIGSKSLIYFCCNGADAYVSMLKTLVSSIEQFSNKEFHYLVIGSKKASDAIKDLTKRPVFLHEIENVTDPVDASMMKLEIFNFDGIEKYNKILFLDCDIKVYDSFESIFDENIKPGKLYTYHNPDVDFKSHYSFYHGLSLYTEEDIKMLKINNILPFNAGQFIFLNDELMRWHFANVKVLYEMWNGDYFYEQCFMNHYFNSLLSSDTKLFKKYIKLILVSKTQDLIVDKPIIHFIGHPGIGEKKLSSINSLKLCKP